MNDFQASDELIAHIKPTEKLALVPYVDDAGFLTWGYGHKHKPGEAVPPWITEAQADALLAGDLAIAGAAVRRLVTVEMTQAQFDGVTDFCFNLGEGRLAASTMLAMINEGNWDGAATECQDWDHAHVHGQLVVLAGLKVRRAWDADHMRALTVEQTVNTTIDNSAPVIFPPADYVPTPPIATMAHVIVEPTPAPAPDIPSVP